MTTVEDCKRCSDWAEWSGVSRRMLVHEMVPAPAHSAQAKVRNWSVGVLTAPRREATLEWCLDGLFRAGFQEPHLFIDGLLRVPERYAGLPITWRERSIGAWPSYLLALSEMVQRDTDADAYLLLQDDAVMFDQGNVREYLESCLWFDDRPGLVSLYCPQPYTLLDPGWHVLPKTWVWGALAFVFPRSLAREFVQHPDVVSHRWNGISAGRAQVDVLIGEWAALHGHKVHYPCPGLVQHVGNTSSLWNDAENQGFRRADWFAGDVDSPFAMSSRWSDFPDERFACRPEFRAEYEQRILTGRMRMSEQRVVICGLCRNVRHFLPRFAARVEQLGSMFRDYRVVLYENDSIDATVEFLEDWQRGNSRVHFQPDQLGSVRYPSIRSAERAARMAEYRNRCRRDVLENFGDYDKVMVVDTDLAGGWSYQGIANTFGHEAWDFVGSCGLIRRCHEQDSEWIHYDAWAFRAINHPSPHSVREVDSLPLEVGLPLMPVLSCFGGLGIYQLHAFAAAEYGGPDCEHVVFHDRMRQQGFDRLFLNPSQVVIYSPD